MSFVESNHSHNHSSFDDLDWLAFCYLMDELDESDRLRFEEQLADDQQAREALAQATELTCTAAAVETLVQKPACSKLPPAQLPAVGRRERVWAALAICASLLAIFLFAALWRTQSSSSLVTERDGQTKSSPTTSTHTEQVAVVWANVQDAFPIQESELWRPHDGESATADNVSEDLTLDNSTSPDVLETEGLVDVEEAILVTPTWMVTAVSPAAKNEHENAGQQEQH